MPSKKRASSTAQLDTLVVNMVDRVNAYYLSNQIDSAKAYLLGLSDTVKQVHYDRLTLHWLMNRAQVLNYENKPDSLVALLDSAVAVSKGKQITKRDLLNFYVEYNGILSNLDQVDSALVIANQAFMLAKQVDTNRLTQTSLDLANIYQKLDDRSNTQKYLTQAWKYADREPELKRYIADLFCEYYYAAGKFDSSVYYLNLALQDTFWTKRPYELAKYMEGSGVLMTEKGNLQQGMKFQLRSKSILDSLGIHNAFTYLNLAETFLKLKQYNKTIALTDSARILLGQENDPNEVRQLWYGIADIYKKIGDYKKANIALDSAYTSYATERDSSLLKYARDLEAKYAAREKDQRIITLALKNKVSLQVQNQQLLIIIVLIIASLATLLAAILFWRRRKLQQMLREYYLLCGCAGPGEAKR
ncbi:hypothetical protein CTE07_49230 [Chitinophaga terrae (ex Kim and Jung 2007)]|nr:hypothetical protein CTE07_49230 [Chitinophaga terrae (ex Kim and Jung 2007)]